ncbi:MAG: adenosine kinase [Bacteroidales bacterium]|jgi:sugar/nucleoside kinase (ribokinase family)|nr:adenosine kinase [Bacteroidales bacterium]
MKKVLGIGNALVDVMTQIDDDRILQEFGLPKGSMSLVDSQKSADVKKGTQNFRRNMTSGGSAANTIHGLAMLDAETGFIGSIGKDETGDFFENDLKKAGVNTFLFRRSTVTGTAVALVTPDTQRTFATHLGAAVELGAEDLLGEYFQPYNILYLEGYLINDKSLVEKACNLAKENNMEVALDLASYNVVQAKIEDFRDIVGKYVDIIFANEEEAKAFTGLDPQRALDRLAGECRIAIVKTGKDGSLVRRAEELIRINPMPVECRDTTGAGDLYAAGFLYGYAQDLPLDVCGALGSILAGNVIELIGARIPENKWQGLRKQIQSII